MLNDEFYMKQALKEAQKAFEGNEVPVGALIVYKGKIIARAHNQVRRLKDPTAHAEILAITQAAGYLSYERLNGTKLYVTIEPCIMCAGAIILSRIGELIYGAGDIRFGAWGSILDVRNYKFPLPAIKVKRGVLKEECAGLMRDFFKEKRTLVQ